jgi:hypothetical protein
MTIPMLHMSQSLEAESKYMSAHKPMAISSITSPPFPNISLPRAKHSAFRPTHSLLDRSPPPLLSASSPESVSSSICSSPPLSLQERRQRNKAASAKYRQKKNQQHGEMRTIISHLTEENALLNRKVEELRRDNEMMRSTCDQLRGRIVASKMLKRMMKTDGTDTSRTKRRRMSGHGAQDHSSHDGQSEENDDDL